jgi:hypothetical protein
MSSQNFVHPLCIGCSFDEGQNFLILESGVYKFCTVHCSEYEQIFCASCNLYHLDPETEERCAWAQALFLDLTYNSDCSESSSGEPS